MKIIYKYYYKNICRYRQDINCKCKYICTYIINYNILLPICLECIYYSNFIMRIIYYNFLDFIFKIK